MKAILVLDQMPTCCSECQLEFQESWHRFNYCAGVPDYKYISVIDGEGDEGGKPDWCPLREEPERYPDDPEGQWAYDIGWNQCLDAILGEEEQDGPADRESAQDSERAN